MTAQTFNEKFDLIFFHRTKQSLAKQFGDDFCPKICDKDHLYGREMQMENGAPWIQSLAHAQNSVRYFGHYRLGEWCIVLFEGNYISGNKNSEFKLRMLFNKGSVSSNRDERHVCNLVFHKNISSPN